MLGYTQAEVEHCFAPRSADSLFWTIFQTYNTLLPAKADNAAAVDDLSLEDFLTGS